MRTSFFGAGPCSLLGRSVMEKLPLASEERTERGLRSTAIAESRRVAQQRTGLSDEGADMARTRRSRPTALEVHPSSSRVRIRCRGTQVPRRRLRDEHREGCLRQDLIMFSSCRSGDHIVRRRVATLREPLRRLDRAEHDSRANAASAAEGSRRRFTITTTVSMWHT